MRVAHYILYKYIYLKKLDICCVYMGKNCGITETRYYSYFASSLYIAFPILYIIIQSSKHIHLLFKFKSDTLYYESNFWSPKKRKRKTINQKYFHFIVQCHGLWIQSIIIKKKGLHYVLERMLHFELIIIVFTKKTSIIYILHIQ